MKATELMIGDWVFVPHNGSATHYGRVCGIYDSGAVSNTLEKDSGLTKASALSPIPLTREILEKNGFRYYHRNFAQLSEESEFALRHDKCADENGVSLWTYGCIKICFVHELQHALKLCGIEKDIVL